MATYTLPNYVEKRLRYYNGQFLVDQDFVDEQNYHVDRQRRHNKLLHTWGIADGLTVNAGVGATQAEVTPGTAIDSAGRQLVLATSRTVDLSAYANQTVLLTIAYDEESTDAATVGGRGDTRWQERPRLEVFPDDANAPATDTHLRLARLVIDAKSTVKEQHPEVRTFAGVRLRGDIEVGQLILTRDGVDRSKWPALSVGAGGGAEATNDFHFLGNVQVDGTTTLHSDLTVDKGKVTLGGPLTVSGATSLASDVSITGKLSVDPKGAGGITIGNPNTTSGGFTSLSISISAASGGNASLQTIKAAGSAYGDLLLNPTAGNVGIGAAAPVAKLDIAQATRTGTHPTAIKGLYITGDFGPVNDGVEFRHTNATQGIGFGFNGIYAAGTNPSQDLNLVPKGTGIVGISSDLRVTGHITNPMWNVQVLFDRVAGPLPKNVNFTTHGGTFVLFVAGSGFSPSGGTMSLVFRVTKVGGGYERVDYVDESTNEPNSHKAFPTRVLVHPGAGAGTYTFQIENYLNTVATDGNDRFYATVWEFPFVTG